MEETLNTLLSEEVERIMKTHRYERMKGRARRSAGGLLRAQASHEKRRVGVMRVDTTGFALYQGSGRQGASVEEELAEMYLAGVSIRRAENILQIFC